MCLLAQTSGSGLIDHAGKLGAAGLFVLLLVKMGLDYIQKRDEAAKVCNAKLVNGQADQLADLHKWHFGASVEGTPRPEAIIQETREIGQEQVTLLRKILGAIEREPR